MGYVRPDIAFQDDWHSRSWRKVHSLLGVDQVLAWERPVLMAIAKFLLPAYLGFQSQGRVRALPR